MILITGGAGFIGCNLSHYLLSKGEDVILFDNLSRLGSENNLAWLKKQNAIGRLNIIQGDICDFDALEKAVANADIVYHLAGQVAVTTSLENPRSDFNNNILGTFNLLEAIRLSEHKPILVCASTNKVYGELLGINIIENATRYECPDNPHGISELQPLDFYSPYGCSKGAVDQYVHDYSRSYSLPTVVFRMSCIYGPRQFGTTHQGWLAHFMLATAKGDPITIYGNGKQVRDILYIDDLVKAFYLAGNNINITKGKIYNVGGGPENTISIWSEFNDLLYNITGNETPQINYADARVGDQCYYVSDIRKIKKDLNWEPKVNVQDGMEKLWEWALSNMDKKFIVGKKN